MVRLKHEDLNDMETVRFQDETYYLIDDVSKYLNEDLSGVEAVSLIDKKYATLERINAGRKREKLSDFNQKLMQAKNFNPKNKQ